MSAPTLDEEGVFEVEKVIDIMWIDEVSHY